MQMCRATGAKDDNHPRYYYNTACGLTECDTSGSSSTQQTTAQETAKLEEKLVTMSQANNVASEPLERKRSKDMSSQYKINNESL